MRYVIGLGTGRCGTASLARLLATQPGTTVRHEDAPCIPWRPSPEHYDRAVQWLQAKPGPVAGDIAHAWISLLPHLADHASVWCVALWRPVEETVASFCEHMPPSYIRSDRPRGAAQFPTYDVPAREAWRRYVTTYHLRLRALEAGGYVRVLPIDALNSRVGQCRILRAAGFASESHAYLSECHLNATRQSNG